MSFESFQQFSLITHENGSHFALGKPQRVLKLTQCNFMVLIQNYKVITGLNADASDKDNDLSAYRDKLDLLQKCAFPE